jgi:acetyl-CoA carboxylase carboxyl transferase subunit beta
MEHAIETRQPVVIFCASGGARMQEGILSLMQMAKTAAAAGRLHRAGLPYLTVLTDPTTAGTLASYASLSDVIIAEPGVRLYFAGPRVIEQNLKIKVPPDLLSSEFHLQHGMVDLVTHRRDVAATLTRLLRLMTS